MKYALIGCGRIATNHLKAALSNNLELVALCEREGFIPRYYVDTPNDKVDRTIQDLQTYTQTLI